MAERVRRTLIIAAAAALLIIAAAVFALHGANDKSSDDSIKAVRSAVYQAAKQCYVIEGAYPESLGYLTDNYGLAVNTKDYRIIYVAYAENLPPEIKVVPRKAD